MKLVSGLLGFLYLSTEAAASTGVRGTTEVGRELVMENYSSASCAYAVEKMEMDDFDLPAGAFSFSNGSGSTVDFTITNKWKPGETVSHMQTIYKLNDVDYECEESQKVEGPIAYDDSFTQTAQCCGDGNAYIILIVKDGSFSPSSVENDWGCPGWGQDNGRYYYKFTVPCDPICEGDGLIAEPRAAGSSHSVTCGNPVSGRECKVDDKFVPVKEADDLEVHKVRCCSDGPLDWASARTNTNWGCPSGISGGTNVPEEGCVSGTFEEAKAYCEQDGTARLCTEQEVMSKCTQGTGCGYDNNYVWTSSEYVPPPPIVQYDGEHFLGCGNPNGGSNCKIDGQFHPAIGAHDMEVHEIRCCGDEPEGLAWSAVKSNQNKGCPIGVVGGSNIPNYGTSGPSSCRTGTFGEAKAYCERGGGRLCTQGEVLDSCTQGSGCGFDNHYVWTSTPYVAPPPIIQTNETFAIACGNPNGGSNCKIDGNFHPTTGAPGLELHEIRCCSDEKLEWRSALQNSAKGCDNTWGGSYIPNWGTDGAGSCRVGTYAEAEAHCSNGGARLCTQSEVLDLCTQGTGCSYDNEYIWTSSEYTPPPPIVQTNETFAVACGNPNNGANCKVDGEFHPTIGAPGLELHEIRCCADEKLEWRSAVMNVNKGCVGETGELWGGSYIPNWGTEGPGSCRVGTYGEAEAFCDRAGARLCTQKEVLDFCTQGSGCSYDNDYVWTSSPWVPPPPIVENDGEFWLACGNPYGGSNCKDLEGDAAPAISGNGLELHEIRCCSDEELEWNGALENSEKGCPAGIWGGSYVPIFGETGRGQCRVGTYGEAEAFCTNGGARLCTFTEVMNKCTQGTGCSFDNEYVWTSTPYEEPDIPDSDGEHWLVCGNPYRRNSEGCKDPSGDYHITYQGEDQDGHELRCCSDSPLDWQGAVNHDDICPGIWSASYIPMFKDVMNGKCMHNVTWGEAKYYCELNGARLCTQIEVANGCTRGSGCAHDADWIWTATEVLEDTYIEPSDGYHTVACGNPNAVSSEGCMDNGEFFYTFNAGDGETHEVRCCSNNDLPWFTGSPARKNQGCSVWGISELPAVPGSIGPRQCYHASTHWEAEAICSLNGARLCTDLEVLQGCTRGSGCGHDRDWVWTASAGCNPESDEPEDDCSLLAHEDEYIGCFEDTKADRLLNFKVGKPMSIDLCAKSCTAAKYAYYGLKNGDTCFCGDSKDNTELDASECNKKCKLGPGMCGGANSVSCFGTGLTPTGTYNFENEYLGCFKDKDGSLDTVLGTDMSIEECVNGCTDANYAIASISDGSICECGNSALEFKSTCLQECKNGKGLCGGLGLSGNSVYKNKNGKKPIQSLLECKGARASWWGDPHFITFDNLAYNCQGFGTFVVAECDDYMVQGLFKPRGVQGSKATVTDGVAAKYKEFPAVQVNFAMFESEYTNYISGKPVHIFVGGQLVNQTETMHDEIDIQIKGAFVEIQFPDQGPSLRIKIRTPRTGVMNVDICVPEDCMDSTKGILGSPDGDQSNEWMTRTGEPIFPRPANWKNKGGYYYCRDEWCVETEEASLFNYGEEYGSDKNFTTFYGCDRPYPGDIDIGGLDPELAGQCAGLPNVQGCLEELAVADPDDPDDNPIDDVVDNNNDIPDIDDTEEPEEDVPPECPLDLKLVGQTGTGFEKWPIEIISRNTTSVTVKVKSPVFSPKVINFLHVNYPKQYSHELECDGFEDVPGNFREEITLQCLHSHPFALLQLFAAGDPYSLASGDNSTLPLCCHPDEGSVGLPGIFYAFSVACAPQCPEEVL